MVTCRGSIAEMIFFFKDPDALVAVTHDSEWVALIETVCRHTFESFFLNTCGPGKTHARRADARGSPRRILIGKLLAGLAT